MGTTKNRDNQIPKKDKRISLRLNSAMLDELQRKSGKNQSKAINEAIQEYLSFKRNPETNYECFNCNKKIKKQEPYYCNLDQLEIRLDEEIIVTKGEPTNILCMKCAKKDKDILDFIESEDDGSGDKVTKSLRDD